MGTAIFVFANAAARAVCLTVNDGVPKKIRAIALSQACGTGLGDVAAPVSLGRLSIDAEHHPLPEVGRPLAASI